MGNDIDLRYSNGFNILEGGIMDITYKVLITSGKLENIQIDELANNIKDDYNRKFDLNNNIGSTFASDRGEVGFYFQINTRTLQDFEDILKKYEDKYDIKFTLY